MDREQALVLRCTACGLPWARIENGVLIVVSNHHGEKHENVIALAELIQRAQIKALQPSN